MILVVGGVIGLLLPLSREVRGGGDPITSPSCFVAYPSGPLLRGTGAVTFTSYDGAFAVVTATVRLRWQGQEKFFRVHASRLVVESPERLVCDLLAAQPVDDSNRTILEAFGFPPAKKLVISRHSITRFDFAPIPNTGGDLYSTVGDIILHVQ